LGESCIQYKRQAVVIDVITITADQAGKPWTIAQGLYTRENALAVLFYLNGYPNPYSINEGDKLLVFDENTINNVVIDNNNISKEFYNVTPQNTTQSVKKRDKLTKIDQNRQDVLAKIKGSIGSSQSALSVISPNTSTGAPSISASDGIITLGTDVSDSRCKSTNLSDTQTRTEQIRAAIKKKLGITAK
jgi:hypothetical protein